MKNPVFIMFYSNSTVKRGCKFSFFIIKMISRAVRYAPMNLAHIPGFPNRIPKLDWQIGLPKFKDQKNDDVALHLVRFHINIHKLGVKLHEDFFNENVHGYFRRRCKVMV